MKLGLQLGYWGAQPPAQAAELFAAADDAGFDAVFTAEAYGSDAFTPLAWWGSATSRVRLGTAIAQLSGRTPTSIAMHALTMDHLSGGRFVLGLGVSGPQVVEGWYGQPFGKPLARTREAVSIIRQVFAREEPVTSPGPHYPLPYEGEGSTGLGKALKSIVHPLRADLPIWLGAEGPKNIALTAEIADGWFPLFYTPGTAAMYQDWLDEGFARPGARRSRADFEIAAVCDIRIVESDAARQAAIAELKKMVALYMGGMGAEGEGNFHNAVFVRMGYEQLAQAVQKAFLSGDRRGALALIPDALIDDLFIVGGPAEVRDKVAAWEASGVTTLLLSMQSADEIRRVADVLS